MAFYQFSKSIIRTGPGNYSEIFEEYFYYHFSELSKPLTRFYRHRDKQQIVTGPNFKLEAFFDLAYMICNF